MAFVLAEADTWVNIRDHWTLDDVAAANRLMKNVAKLRREAANEAKHSRGGQW